MICISISFLIMRESRKWQISPLCQIMSKQLSYQTLSILSKMVSPAVRPWVNCKHKEVVQGTARGDCRIVELQVIEFAHVCVWKQRATSGVIAWDAICGGLNGNGLHGVISSDTIRR